MLVETFIGNRYDCSEAFSSRPDIDCTDMTPALFLQGKNYRSRTGEPFELLADQINGGDEVR
jgi:hypothetical protein